MGDGLGVPVVVAVIVGLVAPFGIRPLLVRLGAVDTPNDRSSHAVPTVRGGGLAPLLAVDAAVIVALLAGLADPGLLLVVVAAANLAAALGFVDDLVGLGAVARLGWQLAIGLGAGVAIVALTGASPWWAPVGMLVVCGYINTANFIDGIDGISGVHGIVVGAFLALAGAVSAQPWLLVAGAVLAASFASFLPWNLRRPGLFLGDVGSYLLGALIGGAVVAAVLLGVSPLLVLPALAPWVVDTAATVIRRFVRGDGVLTAHRTHAYQRLAATGIPHVGVALLVGLCSAVSGLAGVLALRGVLPVWAAFVMIAVVCTGYLLAPRLRGSRLPAPVGTPFAAPFAVPTAPALAARPQRWAVIGASGFVGSAVVAHLRREGVDVVELSAPRLDLAPDLRDGTAIARRARRDDAADVLRARLQGADVVVNAAGAAAPDAESSSMLWGANAHLPAVVVAAARRAGVARVIHVSSAAAQGRVRRLDGEAEYRPFSAYSLSKALGEVAALAPSDDDAPGTGVVVVRATSVQGSGRPTTRALRGLASSRLSSVAAPGTQPSVVSGLDGLTSTICAVGTEAGEVSGIVVQPWEGLSVAEVLALAGDGRAPLILPRALCAAAVGLGFLAGRAVPRFAGLARRAEMMWFGQSQEPGWADGRTDDGGARRALAAREEAHS